MFAPMWLRKVRARHRVCVKGGHVAEHAIDHSDPVGQADEHHKGLSSRFAAFSTHTAMVSGNYKTFIVMLAIVLVWALTGPAFSFSTTWQLVINTGTTIVTFLMVFLIQNTQNRDSMALHLKLDEIIRAMDQADDELIRAEDESEEELADLKQRYREIMLAQRKLLRSAVADHVEAYRSGSDEAAAAQHAPASG